MGATVKTEAEAIMEIYAALAKEVAEYATEEWNRQAAIAEKMNLPPGGFVPGMNGSDERSITVVVKSDLIAPNEIIKQETR